MQSKINPAVRKDEPKEQKSKNLILSLKLKYTNVATAIELAA
jgi:hypothetical protein